MAQMVKNSPTMQETWVWSLASEDPLEKEMATHSSILAWRIPQTKEPGELQSMGSQRVGHDWVSNTSTYPRRVRVKRGISPLYSGAEPQIQTIKEVEWFPACLVLITGLLWEGDKKGPRKTERQRYALGRFTLTPKWANRSQDDKNRKHHWVQTPQAGEIPCHENRRAGVWDDSSHWKMDDESLAAWLLHTEKMTMVRKLDSWSRSSTLD